MNPKIHNPPEFLSEAKTLLEQMTLEEKELRQFEKVELEAGESKNVSLRLSLEDFRV